MKELRQLVAKVCGIGRYSSGISAVLVSFLLAVEASAGQCRISLSQPVVDYGLLRGTEQPGGQDVFMGKRTLRVNVACPEATVIAMRFQGASADGQRYAWGRQGYFNLTLEHPLLDGRPVELARVHNHAARGTGLQPGQTLVVLAGGVPAAGRIFSAQVQVDTWLSGAAIAVSSKSNVEGGGRFELVSAG